MHSLQRLNSKLLGIASWGVIFFMVVMAVVIPYEVFGRYVLQKMSAWSGEVATFSLVWASMLGFYGEGQRYNTPICLGR